MFYSNDSLRGFAFFHPTIVTSSDVEAILQAIGSLRDWKSHTNKSTSDAKMFIGAIDIEGSERGSNVVLVQQRKANFQEFDDLLPNQSVFWIFFRSRVHQEAFVEKLVARSRKEDIVYYRLKLKAFLTELIWQEDGTDREFVLGKLAVHIPNQDNVSNVATVLFSARHDSSLLKNGVIALLRAKYKLIIRAADITFANKENLPVKMIVDGYGNIRIPDYKSSTRIERFTEFVSYLVKRDLLQKLDSCPIERSSVGEVIESPDS